MSNEDKLGVISMGMAILCLGVLYCHIFNDTATPYDWYLILVGLTCLAIAWFCGGIGWGNIGGNGK